MLLLDADNAVADAVGHVLPDLLVGAGALSPAPGVPIGREELLAKELDLLGQPARAADVVGALRVRELLLELLDAALVGGPCLRVQARSCPTTPDDVKVLVGELLGTHLLATRATRRAGVGESGEIENVELPLGSMDERRQVVQAL